MTGEASKVGLHDHERFLRQYPPYSALTGSDLSELVRDLHVLYRPVGSTFDTSGGLTIIRRGEVDLNGEEYGDGETLGGGVRSGLARTQADTWLYVLPPGAAGRWLNHGPIGSFLTSALSARLSTPAPGLDLSGIPVSDVMRPAHTITPEQTVQAAAAQMRSARVSSLLVPLADGYGIVTDKDLRNKVLAEGLPHGTPVSAIMTAPAITVPEDTLALSALNLMFHRHIRHLPILRGAALAGVIGMADLLRLQTRHVASVVQDVQDAANPDTLAQVGGHIPAYAAHLYRSGQRAEQVARLTSFAYDALYRRAIDLAHAELGQGPPGNFAWLLLGSVARRESGLNPDQDHLLLIEHEAQRAHAHQLAQHVETMLARAGLPACEGGVMASQRLYTREEYQGLIRRWFDTPDPAALLNVTIFFDPRVLTGDLDVTGVRDTRLSAREHPAFMAHLTRLAVSQRPAVGRARLLGGRDETLDLKTQGLARIIDLARLHALTVGEPSPNTTVRLSAPGGSLLHAQTREDLLGAYRYLLDLRLEWQVGQFGRAEPLSNRVPLAHLSGPQEVHLREIFKVIRRVQSVLAPQVGGP